MIGYRVGENSARDAVSDVLCAYKKIEEEIDSRGLSKKDIVIADLPGLIKGAANGVGLGLNFLAHIERCRMFLHVCDVSTNNFNEIASNYKIIRDEIKSYNPLTLKKKEIILLSKCDLIEGKDIKEIITLLKKLTPSSIIAISCHTNLGMKELKKSCVNSI